jgi:hypothetical protein
MLPVLLALLTVALPLGACQAGDGTHGKTYSSRAVEDIAAPYVFNLFGWEVAALVQRFGPRPEATVGTPEETVLGYFRLVKEKSVLLARHDGSDPDGKLAVIQRQMDALSPVVSAIIEGQLHETLLSYGITNPFSWSDGLKIVFPPVALKLEKPPRLLVISPRERIEYMQRITLRPDITNEERFRIEAECDRLGVSSLVEDLGGLATYPSMVSGETSLTFVLDTAAEEWLHGYLSFRPLGFAYVMDILGLRPDPEIVTLNETFAGIVSREIGKQIMNSRYARYVKEAPPPSIPRIDFNHEMRITRQKTDELLAAGQVDAAESFMEQRRQFLQENGYYIRKLNQAYFAFHGTYAYHPASVSPVYTDLQALRARSPSLKAFLDRVSAMSSYADLKAALAG